MALPLPFAPDVGVTAERLKDVERERARNTDVTTGVVESLTGAMAIGKYLEEGNKKAAAEAFQRDYASKGYEGLVKMYEEAGKPAGFNVELYKPLPNESAEEASKKFILGAKDLLGVSEKAKTDKATADFGTVISDPTKTPQDVAGAAVKAGAKPGELLTYSATVAKAGDEAKKLARRKEFLDDLPKWEARAIKAARSAEDKAALITSMTSKYGDVPEAIEWAKSIPVKETGAISAAADAREANRIQREELAREGRILRYQLDPQNEKTRSVASSLIAVDSALKGLGVKGGIWDKDATKEVPGRFEKWTKNLSSDPKFIDFMAAYSSLTNEERNRLFGATLTGNEKDAFTEMIGGKEIQHPQYIVSALQKMTRGVADAMMYPGPEEDYDLLRERGLRTVEDLPGFGTAIPARGYLAARYTKPDTAAPTPATTTPAVADSAAQALRDKYKY